MANIRPFRGVRYNVRQIADLSSVISQPYDRIDGDLQAQYYLQSPYNIVRLIWGKQEPTDQPDRLEGPNVYTRAKTFYDLWRAEAVLVQEPQPAIYAFRQTFAVGGQTFTRKGLICALELTPFSEGIVLPHERTHAGPKLDRLRLTRTTQLDLGQTFILYPDTENRINALLDAAIAGRVPNLDAVETLEKDVRQQLWAITDAETIRAVQAEMTPKTGLIIADGHHRYETALAYRDEMRAASAQADAAFKMVTLVSMQDPGLVILPTHREIFDWSTTGAQVLERAAPLFEVAATASLDDCLTRMAANRQRHAIGLHARNGFHLLLLRDDVRLDHLITAQRSLAWKSLDVSILHEIVLKQIVSLPAEAVEQQTHIRYHRDPSLVAQRIDRGANSLLFLLNPTRIDQVRACAQAGEPMPQKSTDFYPKMIAGLTIMPIPADGQIP